MVGYELLLKEESSRLFGSEAFNIMCFSLTWFLYPSW